MATAVGCGRRLRPPAISQRRFTCAMTVVSATCGVEFLDRHGLASGCRKSASPCAQVRLSPRRCPTQKVRESVTELPPGDFPVVEGGRCKCLCQCNAGRQPPVLRLTARMARSNQRAACLCMSPTLCAEHRSSGRVHTRSTGGGCLATDRPRPRTDGSRHPSLPTAQRHAEAGGVGRRSIDHDAHQNSSFHQSSNPISGTCGRASKKTGSTRDTDLLAGRHVQGVQSSGR